jgi:hypothetical protein
MRTPMGVRKLAAVLFTAAEASITAEPPRMSIEVTMMLVRKQKVMKVMWAALPQRTSTISQTV